MSVTRITRHVPVAITGRGGCASRPIGLKIKIVVSGSNRGLMDTRPSSRTQRGRDESTSPTGEPFRFAAGSTSAWTAIWFPWLAWSWQQKFTRRQLGKLLTRALLLIDRHSLLWHPSSRTLRIPTLLIAPMPTGTRTLPEYGLGPAWTATREAEFTITLP